MTLSDPLLISPWTQPCRGEVALPGSKSITNRALILAALTQQTITLEGALFSRDSDILVGGLQALGFQVTTQPDRARIIIQGQGGHIPKASADLFVGNAGTAARFLTALVCLHPQGEFFFDGDPEMRRRPMAGLIRALQAAGAEFSFSGQADCFPFRVRTRGLAGGTWSLDASASSQMLSALLMVAPFASSPATIQATGARPAFVEMTAAMLRQFGAGVQSTQSGLWCVPKLQQLACSDEVFPIEPDVSAASYFMALPLVAGGSLLLKGLSGHSLQGDLQFANVLQQFGLQISEEPAGWRVSRPNGIQSPPRAELDFNAFSDTFLTLAAIAPLLGTPVHILGIGHTRHQETDRIAAAALELRRCGAPVQEFPDSLLIQPFAALRLPCTPPPVAIHTYRDHRVAMSFAILGSFNRCPNKHPWLAIVDPTCCNKTFPSFFQLLNQLHADAHA